MAPDPRKTNWLYETYANSMNINSITRKQLKIIKTQQNRMRRWSDYHRTGLPRIWCGSSLSACSNKGIRAYTPGTKVISIPVSLELRNSVLLELSGQRHLIQTVLVWAGHRAGVCHGLCKQSRVAGPPLFLNKCKISCKSGLQHVCLCVTPPSICESSL